MWFSCGGVLQSERDTEGALLDLNLVKDTILWLKSITFLPNSDVHFELHPEVPCMPECTNCSCDSLIKYLEHLSRCT